MKILLINPPLSMKEQSGGSSLEKVANVTQPLGLAYLAAVLEQEKFEVKIIDCPQSNIRFGELNEMIKRENPEIVGLTATTLSFSNALEVAKNMKSSMPNIFTIIGGPHITASPTDTISNKCFDLGILREGEYTLLETARKIEDEGFDFDRSSIRGVVYREDDIEGSDDVRFTQPRDYIKDLDSLPLPARHLLPPLAEYHPTPASCKKVPLGTMITSRGCPNQCIFCDRKVFGNFTRFHSPKRVVDEIEELVKKFGAKEIKFWDDTFTANQDRAFEICDEILRRKIKITWTCLTRVNNVSKELLRSMKASGCWQVLYGFESGNQKILDIMKKGITLEQSENAARWSRELGFNVRGSFVLGIPGETRETIMDTFNFAKKLRLDAVNFYMLTPYPGTEVYDSLVKGGLILHSDYRFYHEMTDSKTSRLPYVPPGFTEREMKLIYAQFHKKFYLDPRYVLRQLRSIRGFNDIKQLWNGLLAIVGL